MSEARYTTTLSTLGLPKLDDKFTLREEAGLLF